MAKFDFDQQAHDLEEIKDMAEEEARTWLHRHGYGPTYAEYMLSKRKVNDAKNKLAAKHKKEETKAAEAKNPKKNLVG